MYQRYAYRTNFVEYTHKFTYIFNILLKSTIDTYRVISALTKGTEVMLMRLGVSFWWMFNPGNKDIFLLNCWATQFSLLSGSEILFSKHFLKISKVCKNFSRWPSFQQHTFYWFQFDNTISTRLLILPDSIVQMNYKLKKVENKGYAEYNINHSSCCANGNIYF